MRIPSWLAAAILQMLRLVSAAEVVDNPGSLVIGLAFSPSVQPSSHSLSLDLDFFVKCDSVVMPLHLLGKKSWNVYNADNIAKVRRDEAAAKAAEEADEQRMQDVDAERRMRLLRGEDVGDIREEAENHTSEAAHANGQDRKAKGSIIRERKKRKRHGEDDTDFEMRLAREARESRHESSGRDRSVIVRRDDKVSLLDANGHISLFAPETGKSSEANVEATAEKKAKEREYEDQYTMRFANAAGNKQTMADPWYSTTKESSEPSSKDVWGNDDPRRKDRDTARITSSDPLAMMRQGAAQARKAEAERRLLNAERDQASRQLEKEERRRKRRRRHRDMEKNDDEDVDALDLDSAVASRPGRHEKRRHRHSSPGHYSSKTDTKDGHRHKHRDHHAGT